MVPIRERLLSIGPNRPGGGINVKRIIVHRTGDPGADAMRIWTYFESLNHPPLAGRKFASAHFIIDSNRIIRCIPDERAHHCRNNTTTTERPNFDGLGIETCEPLTPGSYRNTVELVAYLCKVYGIPPIPDYVQPHSKYDPVNRAYDPFNWAMFQAGKGSPGKDFYDGRQFYRDIGEAWQKGGLVA